MEYMSDAAPAGPLPAMISGAEYPWEPPHAAFVDGVIADGKAEVYDAGRPMRVYYDV